MNEYLSISEAARLKSVSRAAILFAIRRGKIKGRRVKLTHGVYVWRITPEALEGYTPNREHQRRTKEGR